MRALRATQPTQAHGAMTLTKQALWAASSQILWSCVVRRWYVAFYDPLHLTVHLLAEFLLTSLCLLISLICSLSLPLP